MGGTSGHVALGFAFLIIGLWHLFNSIKLHSLHPSSYRILPWFPLPRFRLLEPFLIIFVTVVFISMEIFNHRTPFLPDGTIPFKNLPNFEHSIMAMSFFVYAVFAALFDFLSSSSPPPAAHHGLLHFLQAVAFGQLLLILHLHSTDHMGLEGQYHWLLQTVTFVSLSATVLAMGFPGSFLIAFVRAFSVASQGVWLVVMGFMLWTPQWMPKGCFLKPSPGREAIVCHGEDALARAKGLVDLLFGLHLTLLSAACVALYLVINNMYRPQENVEYRSLIKDGEGQDGGELM